VGGLHKRLTPPPPYYLSPPPPSLPPTSPHLLGCPVKGLFLAREVLRRIHPGPKKPYSSASRRWTRP
jgi:hypothetical protein